MLRKLTSPGVVFGLLAGTTLLALAFLWMRGVFNLSSQAPQPEKSIVLLGPDKAWQEGAFDQLGLRPEWNLDEKPKPQKIEKTGLLPFPGPFGAKDFALVL